MQLILITGLAGSGKSVALNVLEDSGCYYVDNLPARLLPQVVEFVSAAGHARAAISIDVRDEAARAGLPAQIAELRRRGVELKVLFLEASDDVLIRRYEDRRRRHPMPAGSVGESIEQERRLLEDLKLFQDQGAHLSAIMKAGAFHKLRL